MEESNDAFCSLDMLAEVASATLQNDPTLISNYYLQRSRNNKISGSSTRKSLNSSDKLTLDQIKCLSEKNLIEMFAEHVCDEMKRNYSFQCYLIPEKCSQVFKSFGNETQALIKMKAHLMSHIKDLVAAAKASNNSEIFMAEPLHVRRKRLKEVNRKNTRKKKQSKPISNKNRKDSNYEHFLNDSEGMNFYKSDNQISTKSGRHSILNSSSDIDYDSWCAGFKKCLTENVDSEFISDTSNPLSYSSYRSTDDSRFVDDDQVLLKNWSSQNDSNSPFPEGHLRKKQKSKSHTDSKRKISGAFQLNSFQELSSDYENTSHFNYDLPESGPCLPVHHDHTYTSFVEKTSFCDPSFSGESSKSAKVYKDPFHPKRTVHRCSNRESPLIIPTPPFPYVYNPILPHIAHIQEVGHIFKTTDCRCKNTDDVNSQREPCSKPNNMPHFAQGSECNRNSVNQAIKRSEIKETAASNPMDCSVSENHESNSLDMYKCPCES